MGEGTFAFFADQKRFWQALSKDNLVEHQPGI